MISTTPTSSMMLTLFTNHVKAQLRAELKEHADKIIDQCVEEATKNMMLQVEKQYSDESAKMIFNLTVEKRK